MNRVFVLIHGSWHGGWAWQAVIRSLIEKGYRAYAPTLPGHGPDAVRQGITHQACVDWVIRHLYEHAPEQVILVGHSFGGTVVQKAAEEVPKRIARIVFLDALILEDNECVLDILPAEVAALLTQLARASGEDTMMLPWEIWRDNFIQDAPEPMARSIWEQLSPEPNQVNLDRVDLKGFDSLAIPKSFIYCRQDKAMGAGYFHPRMSSRVRGRRLIEMDGSHEVLFTRPAELANRLIEASAE
jgi:pimeloyl-ACP methyl ester carboxylesterase